MVTDQALTSFEVRLRTMGGAVHKGDDHRPNLSDMANAAVLDHGLGGQGRPHLLDVVHPAAREVQVMVVGPGDHDHAILQQRHHALPACRQRRQQQQ